MPHAKPRDITVVEPKDLVAELKLGEVPTAVDLLIGGPPCQAFARVGRAKLREVAEHPEAFLKDERANLYLRYLHYVKELQPLALVMENVPDILNYGGDNLAEEICSSLSRLGYDAHYTLLNGAHYGVAQMRERMFLIAYAKELGITVNFPSPTHWLELPPGYRAYRHVPLKTIQKDLSTRTQSFYVKAVEPTPDLSHAITARQALDDLPGITSHLDGTLKRGPQCLTEPVPYREGVTPSAYALLMRYWPGFGAEKTVTGQVTRYLPRDYPIFKRMKPGDEYPQAHALAMALLTVRIEAEAQTGNLINEGTEEYERHKKEIVPPYDVGKFPNKWRKMEANAPARTLTAHLGKDSYSHIHYDSDQARTISPREAARLQSFPDGFVFCGAMNPVFVQIGNAVPPLVAFALANTVLCALGLPEKRLVSAGETKVEESLTPVLGRSRE